MIEAIDKLGTFFETDRHRGAKMYGQLWAQVNAGASTDAEIERARRAVVVVAEFLDALDEASPAWPIA